MFPQNPKGTRASFRLLWNYIVFFLTSNFIFASRGAMDFPLKSFIPRIASIMGSPRKVEVKIDETFIVASEMEKDGIFSIDISREGQVAL